MARALLNNFLKAPGLDDLQIMASDINKDALADLRCGGVKTTQDNALVAEFAEILFISVKPADAADVLYKISSYIDADKIIVSIMAGFPLMALKAVLHKAKKFARCMPNLGSRVGEGMTGVAFYGCESGDKADVMQLLQAAGKATEVPETLLDTVTAVSGSGSAYVYLFIKALAEAGKARGFDDGQARLFAAQTVFGAAKSVLNCDDTLDAMVAAVCSKGGTTFEAVNVFNNSDFNEVIDKAVDAAYRKSKVMTNAFKV